MVTMEQLRAILDADEPDYARAASLGQDALALIESLIEGNDRMLASKAAYLAGRMAGSGSTAVLAKAAQSSHIEVRIAAAAAARHLSGANASDLLVELLEDPDPGVRKVALKSVPFDATPALRRRIDHLSRTAPEAFLRSLSSEALTRMRPGP